MSSLWLGGLLGKYDQPKVEPARHPKVTRRLRVNRLGDGSRCRGLGTASANAEGSSAIGRGGTSLGRGNYQRFAAVFNMAPAIS